MSGFFDKVSDLAKTATDKGIEMVEVTKLNSQIRSEESAKNNLLMELGKLCMDKILTDELSDPVGEDLCKQVREREAAIASLELEIQKLKA